MTDVLDNWKSKKIAVLGLAVESMSTIKFLHKHDITVTVLDKKSKKELGDSYQQAKQLGTKFHLGKDYLNGLAGFDVIIRSPGVHRLLPELLTAEKRGVEISSHTILFFQLCPCPIIGVTGTKGKGTTATLIYEILKAGNRRVFLGGNIGYPPLDFLPKLKEADLVVLELSSYQLQDLKQSPNIGVVLNTTADHLDVHKSVREYRQAKEAICKYQIKTDWVIANSDYFTSREIAAKSAGHHWWVSACKTPKDKPKGYQEKGKLWLEMGTKKIHIAEVKKLLLRGQHNWENILPAAAVGYLNGVKPLVIKKTIESFKGLEHRLELVGEKKGIKFYNDSFSTGPQPTIAALRSFTEPIILIVGGYDKGLDYKELGKEIKRRKVKAVVLVGKVGEKIKKELGGYKGKLLVGAKDMKQMLTRAVASASIGDVILLSPAAASFDMFKNYKDRGQQFKEAVKKIR
ncbi:MAG: UDP-N-acetylmuramoyl-L-alanine--D-glutamate ligase [bacterium]